MYKPVVEISVEVATTLDLVVLTSEFREFDRYAECRKAICKEQQVKPRQLFLERQYEVASGVAGALICDDERYVDFKYLPQGVGCGGQGLIEWELIPVLELMGEVEIQLNLWWVANLSAELNRLVDAYSREHCDESMRRPSVSRLGAYKNEIARLVDTINRDANLRE